MHKKIPYFVLGKFPGFWQKAPDTFNNPMKTPLLHIPLAVLLAAVPAVFAGDSPSGMQVYNKGRAALEKGDVVTARQCFEQLLRARPDFDLARIQLAQVVVAERELAKIPQSLKVARKETVPRMELSGVPLEEAAAAVARALERAGGGSEKWTVRLGGHLSETASQREVALSASECSVDNVLEALGFAGGVQFSYTAEGLAVREANRQARGKFDAGDPRAPDMSAAAKKVVLDRIVFQEASPAEALLFLQRKSAELSGGRLKPLFVIRHDIAPRGAVTLDLRSVSLHDAVSAVCLLADLEAKWYPWGAGIGSRQAPSAVVDQTEKEEATR